MSNKIFSSNKNKIIFSFLSGVLFIYVILFEFILPANKVLPKPSIVIESIPSLFSDYNFLSAFLFTFSAIYSIMIVAYFSIKMGSGIFISIKKFFPGLKEIFNLGKYFIPLFVIFLFELWFGSSVWGEYLFILILIMGALKSTMLSEVDKVKEEYIIAAKSLGSGKNEIVEKVVWKSIQPNIYRTFIKNHIDIWGLVIVYEFVCRTNGVGTIFNFALKYNDLSLVVVLIILLMVTVVLMELLLNYIKRKYFFWN